MVEEITKLTNVWENNVIDGIGATGFDFAISIVLLIIFAIALLYMITVALRNDRVKRWLTGELMQAFASAIMILGLIALASFLAGHFYSLTLECAPDNDEWTAMWGIDTSAFQLVQGPIDYMKCKLSISEQQLDLLYQDVIDMNMPVERAEWTCFIFFGTEIACGWENHPLSQSLHAIAYRIVQYRVGLTSALILIEYIRNVLLPVFLPIGIILRAIPFTRGAGGLIIAIVLGFYFVFPILFTLGDLLLTQQLERPDLSFLDFGSNMCVYSTTGGAMSMYVNNQAAAASVGVAVPAIRAAIAALTIDLLLSPLMALAATVLFIRAFSPVLGSESQDLMYGISKLL